jgi:long-subunit fatty acid transport protein
MKPARVFAVALAVVLAGPGASFAQTKTGTAFGDFLLIEPSARATGMGNAGVTLLDDLQGVYYNPAAIAEVSQWGVSFSHSDWLAGINYNYAALGVPLGKIGNGYFSLTALSSGDMNVRTVEQPLGTGELFHVTDIAVGGGYGLRVTDRFSAGLEARFVQETIWHTSASAFVMNMGTVYRVAEEGLHLGASISNFGTQAKFTGNDLDITFDQNPDVFGDNGTLPASQLTDPFPMPVLFRVGVSLPRKLGTNGQLLMAVDAFHPADNTESVSLGTEYSYRKVFSLRAGYQNLFQKDSQVGLTLGAGLKGKLDGHGRGYAVDYAWANQGQLNDTHRITVALHF